MKYRLNLFCGPALFFCALLVFFSASAAHADQTAPPAGQPTAEMQSLSGQGEHFEVVLKFPSFATGSEIALTAYVLDGATNEPVQGATVSGGMSSGTESIAVPFTETDQPVAGAYQEKVRIESDKPASWLFDISLGDRSDLIAIDGFKAGDKSAGPPAPAPQEAKKTGFNINLTPAEIVGLLAVFAILQAAIFLFIRKRFTCRASTEESR